MKPKDLIEFLAVAKKAKVVPHIWGPPGIGKSRIVSDYAKENGYDFIDLRLSLLEPGDLIGMPVIEGEKTVFKQPHWFPEPKTNGVLFLDELNRANEDILQAVFQLILDRKINNHSLPEGWQVICAGNYGADFQVQDLDPALMNRFCHLTLEVKKTDWKNWADKNKINNKLSNIVVEHNMLGTKSNKLSALDLPIKTTPRSWELMNRLIEAELPKKLFKDVAYGLLNPKDVGIFNKAFWIDDYVHVTEKDILRFNEEKLKKVTKQKNVMQLVGDANKKVIDLIAKYKVKEHELTNVIKYIELLPDEHVFMFIAQLEKQRGNIIQALYSDPARRKIMHNIKNRLKAK